MANDLTGESIKIGEVTYYYDPIIEAYTSDQSKYYINAADGDIFEKNFDNEDGELFDWSLYVSNYFDSEPPKASANTSSFFGDILSGIKSYVTNQDFINGVLGKATGIPVRNSPSQGATTNPYSTGAAPSITKKSNTVWYVVGGVILVGIIVTAVIVSNRKK